MVRQGGSSILIGKIGKGIAAVKTRDYEHYYLLRSRVLRCYKGGFVSSCLVSYVMRSQRKHSSAFSLLNVCLAVLEQALPDERLAE